jgi:uncharacterized membrane protein YdjX (TVP38/TMEM64 family)
MDALRNFFWALALAVIAAYLFFLVLGAFNVADVLPVSITVGALVVLWGVHAWLQSRHRGEARDPLLARARERRGF